MASKLHSPPKQPGQEPLQRRDLALKIITLLKYGGIGYEGNTLHLNWMAHIAAFCYVFNFVFQIIGLVQARRDTDKLLESFSILTFCGMGILKLLSLRNNFQLWNSLLNTIASTEKEQLQNVRILAVEYDSDNERHDKIDVNHYIDRYYKRYLSVFSILIKIYALTGIIYVLAPFAEYALSKIIGTELNHWPHILPGWYPFDSMNVPGYAIMVLIEFVTATYCVYIHSAFDLASIAVCIFICGQFHLLRDYSENIAGRGNNWKLSIARDDRAHYRIIECHRMHVLLTKSTDTLRKLLKNILGVYFFIATFTLCSVGVRVNAHVLSVVQMISWIQYMCGWLTQLFLFCYYGDNVFHQSSIGMGEGPFGAACWCVRSRIGKELSILAIGMSKPQRLRAGPFVFVTLSSFIQIIRTAYSYYALVKQ